MLKTCISISLLLCFKQAAALSLKHNDHILTKKYLKTHKEFSNKLCPPGIEESFWQKYKDYTKRGYFVPTLPNKTLDRKTIVQFLPLLKKKSKWIEKNIQLLEDTKTFDKIFREIEFIKTDVKELLDYKKNYNENTRIGNQGKAFLRLKSEQRLIHFAKRIKTFLESLFFLHNYDFPVDHFQLRKKYDEFKERKDVSGKRRANGVFFYRKIVEDGTFNNAGKKSDKYLRALIDSLSIGIDREREILGENMRYDLYDFLHSLDKYLKKHRPRGVLERLRSWNKRAEGKIAFLQSISEDYLQKKISAEHSLKTFVLDKLAETYTFWANKEEFLRALFVLETILFNEVGRVDENSGLERRDIIQVIFNRLGEKKYNSFEKDDPLLSAVSSVRQPKDHWLDVMLKEGEFSFSYFFITGNLRIYCPDMSQSGRSLRGENIKLALELLRKPRSSFKALRYFSRASMLGRIDMEKLWKKEGYRPLGERSGLKAKNEHRLGKLYNKGRYLYLYKFTDTRGKSFRAVLIDKKIFVMPLYKTEFYNYRNPHFFKYFVQD